MYKNLSPRTLPGTPRPLRLRAKRAACPVSLAEVLESRTLLSTAWFVATSGSDQNLGTLSAPFRTIQHAADSVAPGDTVLIRGGVYRESVQVPTSGTTSEPITFKAYGNEAVTIDGADPITGWNSAGGGVYSSALPWDLGQGNNQIFVDGKMMNEARWPNTGFDLTHPTLATASSVSGVTMTQATVNDPALTQPANFWVGGNIRIGPGQDWVNQTGVVTASGPGFVTFSYEAGDPKYQEPVAGNQFYLFGVPGALDAPGEWFRNSGGQLSLETPADDNPANHLVEAKARLYGFDLSQAAYIHIQNLNLFACTINTSGLSTGVVIDHIAAQYLSHFSIAPVGWMSAGGISPAGILLRGNYDTIENSVIAYSAGDGIFVGASDIRVWNNLIHDVDYAGVDSAGIRVGGWDDHIIRNTVYNAGRTGLLFSGGDGSFISNYVHDFGQQTQDVGGFYTFGLDGYGTQIDYNYFANGGSGAGFGSVGIFFDGASSDFLIHHNVTTHVTAALRMNFDTHNIHIYNNTFDATDNGVDKNYQQQDWTGTVIENNIITHQVTFGDNVVSPNNISNHGQFVDGAHGNFLLLTGAPAIDAGLVISPYTDGYLGAAPDIGAFEYGKTPWTSGAWRQFLPTDPSAPTPRIVRTPWRVAKA